MKNFDIKEELYNLEAEQAVIGALLYNNLLYEKISFLLPEHFYIKINQEIIKAIFYMIDKGQIATPITISPLFKDNEIINLAGGNKYWSNLVTNVGPLVNITFNAEHIKDMYLRRSMIDLSLQCISSSQNIKLKQTIQNIIEETEVSIFKLSNTNTTKSIQEFNVIMKEVLKDALYASKQQSLVGVSSGLHKMDYHLGGFHNSDLIILAARPSMGKTALAINFAFNAAKKLLKKEDNGASVCFFSLEMSAKQLMLRIVGQESEIPSDRIRRGAISNNEYNKLEESMKDIINLPLIIDDTPPLTMAGLRTRARRMMRQDKIGLIIIDYLQLLRSDSSNYKENRVQELSEITRGLKSLAKELDVPIIALSQLSRDVEKREDKQPQLSDLRESGSIEQDADVVMFIYREAYYESRKKPSTGSDKMQEWQTKMSKIYNKAEVIIAKQRHGPIGNILLHFDESLTKFDNLENN